MQLSTNQNGTIESRMNPRQLHTLRGAVAVAVDQYWADAAASEIAKNERLKDQFVRQARDAQALLDHLSVEAML